MENTPSPNMENQLVAIAELQMKHRQLLEDSDILRKIDNYLDLSGKMPNAEGSWPIVVGSGLDDENKMLCLLLREPPDANDKFSDRIFVIGNITSGVMLPNQSYGFTIEELGLVNQLHHEALDLSVNAAPGYNTQFGVLR